jgi:DNA polymerase-1
VQDPDRARVHDLFTRWEFKALLRDAPAPARGAAGAEPPATQAEAVAVNVEYETVLTREQLDAWIARISAVPLTAIDVAYTGVDPMRGQLVGIAFSVEAERACYVPLAHRYAGVPAQLSLDATLQQLRPWIESEQHKKAGHDLKLVAHVLANHGLRLGGIAHDTLLQSYVLEAHRNHEIDSLAQRHLGRRTLTLEDVCGKGVSRIEIDAVTLERATAYGAETAEISLALHRVLWPRIEEHEPLRYIYVDLEIAVCKILFEMERTGVLVDRDALARQSAELGRRILELEERAHELAGQPFNLGSPKQIGEILFGKLQVPVVKKTASGAPSTDEEVLEKLALDYPLPKALLEHRGLAKLKSTYCDKLPASVNPATGRVHTSYGQAVAVTGRLSSSEPNLQNIPIRTHEGRRIREAFIAPPGSRIVSADYSQIELRIMAHISGDEGLLAAFTAGEDIHRATASEVFGVPLGEVSAQQRRYAKVINFGLIYGMSAFGLASNLGIDRDTAKNFIDRYFTRYPGVARYMERTRVQAKQHGYVETVFGRRLWLAEINSPNGPRRQAAERAAINAPMQGTAADLIKLAMIAVSRWLHAENRHTRLIMQVHDELVLEVPETELEAVRARVPALMCGVTTLKVPLVADVGVGANWDQAH